MAESLDGKIKNEIIALSNLKESIKEENKEKKEDIALLEKQSLELYYKIDDKKTKELELTFNQLKLKVNFSDRPYIYLRDGKFYSTSDINFIIYEDKLFKKLHEIQISSNIISAIQLDNNDLVFAIIYFHRFILKNEIRIYRLKDNKYYLLQKIKEDNTGYSPQYSGCIQIEKDYDIKFLKEISGNRFLCITGYGFKLYCLNDKNEYSAVLLEEHLNNIKIIQELNEKTFIFCSEVYQSGTKFFIEIIELKEITKSDIDNKICQIEKKIFIIILIRKKLY